MKNLKKSIAFNIIIMFILIAIGCTRVSEIEEQEIKIGVSVYNQEDTFISSISNFIKEKAKRIEEEEGIKIIVDFLDAKGNMIEQGNQVDKFITQKYDIICMNIVDRTLASTFIDKAKTVNIPIVFFNREIVEDDMNRWDKIYYVGAQSAKSGELQGEIVSEEYIKNSKRIDKNNDGKIQYAILEGEEGHQDTTLRTEYCTKALSENGVELEKIASDTANWRRDQAKSKMQEWLKEYNNKIEVIFSNNDEMALGAADAINLWNKKEYNPIVIGVDGIEDALNAIENEEITGTIISDAKVQGEIILDLAYNLAKNKNYYLEEKVFKIPHEKITKENVSKYKLD